MDNNVICAAEIKHKKKKAVFLIYYAVLILLFAVAAIPKTDSSRYSEGKRGNYEYNMKEYHWLFMPICKTKTATALADGYYYIESMGYHGYAAGYDDATFLAYEIIGEGVPIEVYSGVLKKDVVKTISPDKFKKYKKGEVLLSETDFDNAWFLPVSISLVLILMPIVINMILSFISKRCSLKLTDMGVSGIRKKLFSTKNLDLPIDKVDSIMRSTSFYNKLTGGNTVAIRSASGLIKFPWVQNADEFVNATLAKIEEYKKTVKNDSQELIKAVASTVPANNSAATKIKELKDLLDQGLISQDEFESKRVELLNKM